MRFLFGNGRRAREDALVWLARLKRGLRQNEGPALLTWLKRRSHRMAIARAAVEWHGPEVLAVLSEIFPIPPAIVEPSHRPHPTFLAAATLAGACVTLGIPASMLWTGMHGHAYASALASTRRVTLEDGTRVELNRGTQINVIYASHACSVSVARGEALFTIASDPQKPFYIHAAGRDFVTSSATFDIRLAEPSGLSLTVLQGTVTALPGGLSPAAGFERIFNSRANEPILLKPLQMLVMEPDEESGQTLTQQDLRARLAWQKGT